MNIYDWNDRANILFIKSNIKFTQFSLENKIITMHFNWFKCFILLFLDLSLSHSLFCLPLEHRICIPCTKYTQLCMSLYWKESHIVIHKMIIYYQLNEWWKMSWINYTVHVDVKFSIKDQKKTSHDSLFWFFKNRIEHHSVFRHWPIW